MKVAIVYDRVNKWGGAERVLLALHELFPKAPLYTSVYNPKTAPWARVFRVKTSFLQKIPFASSFHELLAPLMPLAFRSFSFSGYDLVISVTSEYAKGIKVSGKTVHICYCLTPTRYLWSGYKEYFSKPIFRFVFWPFIVIYRFIDKKISKNPHIYVAISEEIKKRIKKYYGQDSVVLYPPVDIKKSKEPQSNLSGYFLVVARLVAYKKVDIAVKACTKLGLPLIVIGNGWEEKRLKKIAGPSVFFVKNLTDSQLLGYYKNCLGLIFPGREDFGLSIVEVQACGKPVIAYKKGGALETVIEGKTGTFFPLQNVESLITALKTFRKLKFNKNACIKNADRFNKKKFTSEFKKLTRKALKTHKKL